MRNSGAAVGGLRGSDAYSGVSRNDAETPGVHSRRSRRAPLYPTQIGGKNLLNAGNGRCALGIQDLGGGPSAISRGDCRRRSEPVRTLAPPTTHDIIEKRDAVGTAPDSVPIAVSPRPR